MEKIKNYFLNKLRTDRAVRRAADHAAARRRNRGRVALVKKSRLDLAWELCQKIQANYNESAWGEMGHPRNFISRKNPGRSFVTWTSGDFPDGYARYYIRDIASPLQRAILS